MPASARSYPSGAARKVRAFHNLSPQGVTAAARREGLSTFDKYVQLAIPVAAAAAVTKQAAAIAKRAVERTDGTNDARNAKRKASRALVKEQSARDIAAAAARMEHVARLKAASDDAAREVVRRRRAYQAQVAHDDAGRGLVKSITKRLFDNVRAQRARRFAFSVSMTADVRNEFRSKFADFKSRTMRRDNLTYEEYEHLMQHGTASHVYTKAAAETETALLSESHGNYVVPGSEFHSFDAHEIFDSETPPEQIRMRDSLTLLVDGGDQKWDTGNGRCVIDYFKYKLGREEGFIKIATMERLTATFNELNFRPPPRARPMREGCVMRLDANEPATTRFNMSPQQARAVDTGEQSGAALEAYDCLKHGVSSEQIRAFCVKNTMSMIGFDADDVRFTSYFPPTKAKACVIFRHVNSHFYPIEDITEVKSRRVTADNAVKSDIVRPQFRSHGSEVDNGRKEKKSMKSPRPWDWDEVVVVEGVKKPNEYFFNKCVELSAIPGLGANSKSNIYFKGCVQNFSIGKTMYMINQKVEQTRKLCARMDIEYRGQTPHELMFKVVNDLGIDIPKSIMNNDVYDSLAVVGVKQRVHYGCENGFTREDIALLSAQGRVKAADISKAYAFALWFAKYGWPVIQFHNQWEKFAGDFTKCGLYKVITDDFTVMNGNNIYSPFILVYCKKKGIPFEVKEQLIATRTLPPDFFQSMLEEFATLSEGDSDMLKSLFQPFSGYLAKDQQTTGSVKVSNSAVQIMNHFKRECLSRQTKTTAIMDQIGIEGDRPWVLYGEETTKKLAEHNIPIWITMIDISNVRASMMRDEMGGTLAARKTDCVVVVDGCLPRLGTEWGDYRECDVPAKLGRNSRDGGRYTAMTFPPRPEYQVAPFNNSDDATEIAEAFIANGGGLCMGRAGTGKTMVLETVAKVMADRVPPLRAAKAAFTNKASRNIVGSTIHTLLSMDKRHLISEKAVRALSADWDYILVDEASMIPATLLRALCMVIKLTPCKVIIFGDDRQCPPVEKTGVLSYFFHPAIQSLANNMRVELTVPHRYDMHLFNLLENIDAVDAIKEFGSAVVLTNRVNICWTNRTRVAINHAWMRHERPDGVDPLFLAASESVEKSQDTWVYPDLPVMAIRNHRVALEGAKKGDPMTLLFANSDTFIVTDFTRGESGTIDLKSTTKNIPEFTVSLSHDDFTKYLVPAYASTVHKNQGDTILTPFTVWEWPLMTTNLRYTAVSRAKLADQVKIGVQTEEDLEDERKLRRAAAAQIPAIIGVKIAGHRAYDLKHNHTTGKFVTLAHVLHLHKRQSGECNRTGCGRYMKLVWYSSGDKKQLSINRLDNDQGHIEGNCELTCWGCESTPTVNLLSTRVNRGTS